MAYYPTLTLSRLRVYTLPTLHPALSRAKRTADDASFFMPGEKSTALPRLHTPHLPIPDPYTIYLNSFFDKN
ncbi:hypothetical protein [Fischerella sp. JS2]|uniref:hypothetical protein n=1 Tax=Fischerella sp. JS2 TaxID=2597771 RepID=UPI0028EFDB4A|nr:hypothetical protein [Fischerella sp. JS2]